MKGQQFCVLVCLILTLCALFLIVASLFYVAVIFIRYYYDIKQFLFVLH